MKRFAIAALVVSGLAAPVMACNADMLTVTDWQATENGGDAFLPYRIEATVEYNGDRPYRMIHAGVMFADALGESLGQVNLPRDAVVQPGHGRRVLSRHLFVLLKCPGPKAGSSVGSVVSSSPDPNVALSIPILPAYPA